jgi:hypothetical protein
MNELVSLDDISIRDKIFVAEAFLKEQPQVDIPVQHYFSQGVYAREITIPAGLIITGEIHKFAQLNILSKGRMQVYTEEGIREVEAPFTVVSPPGTKRIAHTLTECVWTTIHGTDETDIDIIRSQFIAKDEREWLEFSKSEQLELGF